QAGCTPWASSSSPPPNSASPKTPRKPTPSPSSPTKPFITAPPISPMPPAPAAPPSLVKSPMPRPANLIPFSLCRSPCPLCSYLCALCVTVHLLCEPPRTLCLCVIFFFPPLSPLLPLFLLPPPIRSHHRRFRHRIQSRQPRSPLRLRRPIPAPLRSPRLSAPRHQLRLPRHQHGRPHPLQT